jgi:hypothetical protein
MPIDASVRSIAKDLFDEVRGLAIVSMHGHVEAGLFTRNEPFSDPVSLLLKPDHYVTRLLHSEGVALEKLGVGQADADCQPETAWRVLAAIAASFMGRPRTSWPPRSTSAEIEPDRYVSSEVLDGRWELTLDHGPKRIYRLSADLGMSGDLAPTSVLHNGKEIGAQQWSYDTLSRIFEVEFESSGGTLETR